MANEELFKRLFPTGIGSLFLQQLEENKRKAQELQGKKGPVTPKPAGVELPLSPQTPLIPPSISVPTSPIPEQQVGTDFLKSVASQPEITPPTLAELDPTARINFAAQSLAETGYRITPENVELFIRNNNKMFEIGAFDPTGLKPLTDAELVPPLSETIGDTFENAPVMAVSKGIMVPLEALAEGFQRWETAKTNLLRGKLGELGGSIIGEGGVTSFPEASLRTSERPELGDFFRKIGLPEFVSATGGVILDVLTDVALFVGAGGVVTQLSKATGKVLTKFGVGKASKKIVQAASKLSKQGFATLPPRQQNTIKEAWLTFKSNSAVKHTTSVLKGESKYAGLSPEAVDAFETSAGRIMGDVTRATRLGGSMKMLATPVEKGIKKFFAKPNEKVLGAMRKALDGDAVAMANLSKDQQAVMKSARALIDKGSAEVKEELTKILTTLSAKQRKVFASRFGISAEQKITSLVSSIDRNIGSYVKRSYMMFMNPKYKPSQNAIKNGVETLIKEEKLSKAQATKKINKLVTEITERQEVTFKTGKQAFKIDGSSFRHRNEIPAYVRQLMGEIDDPIFSTLQAVRTLAEMKENFKLFARLKDLNLFSTRATAKYTKQVPKNGPLQWGAIDGMFTTPEMEALLTHINNFNTVSDRLLVQAMHHVKGLKTIFNPKTHSHNTMGNFFFGFLDGVTPVTHPRMFKEAVRILRSEVGSKAGKPLKDLAPEFLELVENGIIKTEFPSAGEIKWLEELITNPYSVKSHGILRTSAQGIARGLGQLYAWEDQIFKVASYLHKTRVLKMAPVQARREVFKWYPNYLAANKVADIGRKTGFGLFMLNPFITFRLEAHRILLNAMKDPVRRYKAMGILGATAAANASMLGVFGKSFEDIQQIFQTRPEAMSEVLFNPLNPELDLNLKYINPFEVEGLFAPLMAASGASGVNPFDYLLSFTQFSPEFGYSNLILNGLEPLLSRKGRFGQELSFIESLGEAQKRFAPSSFSVDVPKLLSDETDDEDKRRALLRFVGIDVEKRGPRYLKTKVNKFIKRKLKEDPESIDSLTEAVNFLGFDADKMIERASKSLAKQQKKIEKPKKVSQDPIHRFIETLNLR